MTLRRVGTVGSVGVAYHIPAGVASGLGAAEPARRHPVAVAERPAVQGPRRIEAGDSANARADNSHDPGLFTASCIRRAGQARRRPRHAAQGRSRTSRQDAVHRRRSREGQAPQQAQRGATASRTASGMAQALSSASALRRLAAAVHPARPRRRGHGRRREPRRQDLFPEAQPHRRHVHSDDGAATAGDPRGAGDRHASSRITRAERPSRAGEAFDPSPANLDARIEVVEYARHQGRPVAQRRIAARRCRSC